MTEVTTSPKSTGTLRLRRFLAAAGVASAVALLGASAAGAAPIRNDDKVGQPCTVTSGPNKGKKGTYTRESNGSLWCEGSWGGTECGTGKCKSALVVVRSTPADAPLVLAR